MRDYVKEYLLKYIKSLNKDKIKTDVEADTEIELNPQEMFKEIFTKIINRDNSAGLLDYLIKETDFFVAPASTAYHNAFESGLVEHSLNVFYRLRQLVASSNLEKTFSDETIAIVSLLHDICKTNVYSLDYRNVKVYSDNGTKFDKKGRFDWEMQEIFMFKENLNLSHGAKSLYLIQLFMGLNADEAVAIQRHMGGYDFPGSSVTDPYALSAFRPFPLSLLLHTADTWATFLDEDEPNDK